MTPIQHVAERAHTGRRTPSVWSEVLLATDGSENASRAADVVACIAGAIGAHVTVAAVAVEHDADVVVPWQPEPAMRSVSVTRATHWLRPQADRLRDDGIDVTEIVLEGEPAEAIEAAARARGIDLIVLGHHGADAGSLPAPGSVVEALSHTCPCPLLIVP